MSSRQHSKKRTPTPCVSSDHVDVNGNVVEGEGQAKRPKSEPLVVLRLEDIFCVDTNVGAIRHDAESANEEADNAMDPLNKHASKPVVTRTFSRKNSAPRTSTSHSLQTLLFERSGTGTRRHSRDQ
jgi:hypothetical protein